MNKYWKRFFWNLRNLGNDKLNPYVLNGEDDLQPKTRTAWEDLGHSFKNLWAHTPSK